MKRVLLVDDESSSSEIIRYFIEKNELPLQIVGEASNGRDALVKMRTLKPDLVFLDIEMPVMNGLQVMQEYMESGRQEIDFIIITAYDVFLYAQQALRLGARDFLLKPVMYEQFCETMKRVLGYEYCDNPMLNRMVAYIDEHYMEDIHCGALSEQFHVSQSSTARLFKKYLNMNFTDYLNEVRIRKAITLLREGLPIKEVAERAGYHNLNYFYRMFRKKTGMTPKEYN